MIRTIGFPGRYIQGPGAMTAIAPLMVELGFDRPVVLCDAVVEDRVWPSVDAGLRDAGLAARKARFPGETTRANIAALAAEVGEMDVDVVLALGGGKTIDTAKGVALSLDLPILIAPTIASNDAPTSRLIVVYDDAHQVVGVDYLKANPLAVVVDTDVIVQAPSRFFAAGIGDAISKKFEARQCARSGGVNSFGTPPTRTALLLADATYDAIRSFGPDAYAAVREGRRTDAVEALVEATVLLSGLGFESGGLSLAHALIRGTTAIPTMAAMLHGELVGFGTLVQLFVEGRDLAEIDELADLLIAVDLPVTFVQLGQHAPLTPDQYRTVADATLAAAYAKNMAPPLTADALIAALDRADAYGRERLGVAL